MVPARITTVEFDLFESLSALVQELFLCDFAKLSELTWTLGADVESYARFILA